MFPFPNGAFIGGQFLKEEIWYFKWLYMFMKKHFHCHEEHAWWQYYIYETAILIYALMYAIL